MVEFHRSTSGEPILVQDGVTISYNCQGVPVRAESSILVKDGSHQPVTAVFTISNRQARFEKFIQTGEHRSDYRVLPDAIDQLLETDVIESVERPEKTIGEKIMRGHTLSYDQ